MGRQRRVIQGVAPSGVARCIAVAIDVQALLQRVVEEVFESDVEASYSTEPKDPHTHRVRPARVPVPIPALGAVQAAIDARTAGPLLRTRSGAGMDRRTVHRYVAATAKAAGITRPIGPHALRRTVGTVGLNQGIPLRDVQRLLRHARPETTLGSYDITGEALERQASHQVAGFLAGWAG